MPIAHFHEEFWQWIAEHSSDDPVKLRLASSRWHQPWISEAINQVQRRQRASKKLPQLTSNPRTFISTDLSVEQCTSEALARYHASLISEGDSVVDLTSGLGIDAMALARRARRVTAIERDPVMAEALDYNASVLSIDNLRVVCDDCANWLKSQLAQPDPTIYDVCFIDPARRGDNGQRVYGLSDCQPDVLKLLPDISRICRRLIVKMSPMLDIYATHRELQSARRIIALGTTTECKELIADVDFSCVMEPGTIAIEAVTLRPDGTKSTFSLTRVEESESNSIIAMPQVGQSLYIPYPAVMKAGGMRTLSSRYGLAKPAANTQLFYGSGEIADFPGVRLSVIEVSPYASSVIKRLSRRYPVAMVSERNMGISADALRRKLAIRDGGDTRIIGFTAEGGSRWLLIAR